MKAQYICYDSKTLATLSTGGPGQSSGPSVENRTIAGNPYFLVLFEIILYRGLN